MCGEGKEVFYHGGLPGLQKPKPFEENSKSSIGQHSYLRYNRNEC